MGGDAAEIGDTNNSPTTPVSTRTIQNLLALRKNVYQPWPLALTTKEEIFRCARGDRSLFASQVSSKLLSSAFPAAGTWEALGSGGRSCLGAW